MKQLDLATVNNLSKTEFVDLLKDIFEHSPWVAEGAYGAKPFANVSALHAAMVRVVETAGEEKQLALIRAHPDLAGKAARAGDLTAASTGEQAGAGLNRLTDEEFERFHELNNAYKKRFDFPFILAVKGHTKDSILTAFGTRLANDRETERQTALKQIYKITRFRLVDLISEG